MSSFNRFYLAYLLKGLKYTQQSSKKSSLGFTLLELLITVIIIGILAAIAIPSYVATVDKFHYGKAKIQMGCLKRELEGYRIEKGYFPPDVNSNRVPVGIECFYQQNTNQVPYNSTYDYENWPNTKNGERGCVIQITFLGKDNQRARAGRTYHFQEPGFYEFPTGDDLILSLGFYEDSVC